MYRIAGVFYYNNIGCGVDKEGGRSSLTYPRPDMGGCLSPGTP